MMILNCFIHSWQSIMSNYQQVPHIFFARKSSITAITWPSDLCVPRAVLNNNRRVAKRLMMSIVERREYAHCRISQWHVI